MTVSKQQRKPWPVMVLAYNEERRIVTCLDSILAADPDREFDIFVMANGCTDCTEAVVSEYSRSHPQVTLVSIALGDKCNAWNVFIHETVPTIASGRDVYFFMDGDARVVPGSFSAMARALVNHPHAHAAAAVPASGRNVERDRREVLERHELVANLYAMRGAFVERLHRESVRIPLKLEGDDGLIGALIMWDLDPAHDEFDRERVVPCADAAFEFESMSLLRPSDWRTYWKRAIRYGRRRYEFELLGARLRAMGLAGLPRDITELYVDAETLPLRRDGVYTLTNWIALNQMRRIAGEIGGRAAR